MSGRLLAAISAAAVAFAAVSITLVLTSNHESNKAATATLATIAGLSFIGSGLVALWRRPENRTGVLLGAVGFAWFLGALVEANDDWLFTFGFAFGALAFGPFIHLVLAFPSGVLERRFDRVLVGISYAFVAFDNILVLLVDETPHSNCETCRSTIAVWNSDDARSAFEGLLSAFAIVVLAALLVRVVQRFVTASKPLRRLLGPVLLAGGATLAVLVVELIVDQVSPDNAGPLPYIFFATFALVPFSFLVGILRARLAQSAVSRLMVELGGAPSADQLRSALAEALHDPTLEVVYAVGDDRFADAEGRPVSLPDPESGRMATTVEREGRCVAALIHDATLADEPALVEAVAAAAALALDNERLQAELKAQYDYLVTVVNTAPSLLVAIEPDGTIVNSNIAVAQASGLERPEEIRGKKFWEVFIDPQRRDDLRQRLEAASPDFEAAEYEHTFTNSLGEEVVIAWSSAPLRDEDGKVIRIIAGGIDVTERKRKERLLQKSEERLRAAIQASPVAMVEVDLEGRVATWNPAAEHMFGWTPDEVIGRRLPVLPPDDREEFVNIPPRMRGRGTSGVQEGVRRRKDGTTIEVAISAAPIRNPAGEVVSHMTLFADITERKQREREIEGQRDFLSDMGDTIPSILVLTDLDGQILPDGVNREFRDLFGWTTTDAGGKSVLDFVHPEDDYLVRMAIASAANGVPRNDLETRFLRREGEPLLVAWSATPIRHPSAGDLVLISGLDITGRKAQEDEIRASRARLVEAADAERRRLERNLHDGAQQRLVSLSLSLRLAQGRIEDDPAGAQTILAAARDELGLAIEELRELARGIHPAVLTDRGLVAALESLASRAPLPVEFDVPDGRLPPSIEAAAYYIVSEALTNVAKYARADSARVRITRNESFVLVEVADDGVGGADPKAGTGLRGLADRVAALDGVLEVSSPGGEGTRIRAELPVREPVFSA